MSGRKVDWGEGEDAPVPARAPARSAAASREQAGPSGGAPFGDWFERFTGHRPHGWQERLAMSPLDTRLIRVPTGLGKTAGVIGAWAWNRLDRSDRSWPRRLAFCLPMRVLVEQTAGCVREWLDRAGLLWDGKADSHRGKVGVHELMGGVSADEWHLHPEECAILIGTQDMLLSRALNRGYGSARARWPMEFAQLHQDCLWVLDEVQLMDVGLATSVQLQAFREGEAERSPLPAHAWWMSATLQEDWLRTCVDFAGRVNALPRLEMAVSERSGPLWKVKKSVEVVGVPAARDPDHERWAELVLEAHRETSSGITLAVANTVRSATALHSALKGIAIEGIDLRLVHSRFRGLERARWRGTFLSREACEPKANRIIVATQVVEAGVDISADALVTEVAPWPSLVQRFGRCARYGGSGRIVVVDRFHDRTSAAALKARTEEERAARRREEDARTSRPYGHEECSAALTAARRLEAADPRTLERFEADLKPKERSRLYPYEPAHVLTRREFDDLFDTGPDLTGADLDVSRFIRSGDERDVQVWWWRVPEDGPSPTLQPPRDALCPVPFLEARRWLAPQGGAVGGRLRAWVWDYLDDEWRELRSRDVYPGQIILVDLAEGGYDPEVGFTGERAARGATEIPLEESAPAPVALLADLAQDQDDLSVAAFKTIGTHGAEAAAMATALAAELGLEKRVHRVLHLAGRTHDLGKAHPVFRCAIRDASPFGGRQDLAKAPADRWHSWKQAYAAPGCGKRPGFRHELASTLALFELLRRARPDHPALIGEHGALLEAAGVSVAPPAEQDRMAVSGFIAELCELDAASFDLVAWLVCTHHGKVRATWQATPLDQDFADDDGRGPPLRGVRDGDTLAATGLADGGGAITTLPPLTLHLDPAAIGLSPRYGPSWIDRVARLHQRWGPFTLAYFEVLLRVADVRASRLTTPDPLLAEGTP